MKFLLLFLFMLFMLSLTALAGEGSSNPAWFSTVSIIAGFCVLVLEFFLGQTKWIKPNSIVASIFLILKQIGKGLSEALKQEKEEEKKEEVKE